MELFKWLPPLLQKLCIIQIMKWHYNNIQIKISCSYSHDYIFLTQSFTNFRPYLHNQDDACQIHYPSTLYGLEMPCGIRELSQYWFN